MDSRGYYYNRRGTRCHYSQLYGIMHSNDSAKFMSALTGEERKELASRTIDICLRYTADRAVDRIIGPGPSDISIMAKITMIDAFLHLEHIPPRLMEYSGGFEIYDGDYRVVVEVEDPDGNISYDTAWIRRPS
jgi:hypothetical protein